MFPPPALLSFEVIKHQRKHQIQATSTASYIKYKMLQNDTKIKTLS
jgi:hypothetical protein